MMSHPTWVRGLKFSGLFARHRATWVAPHVGAWIEILRNVGRCIPLWVAPHVGAWIEIDKLNGCKYQPYVAPHVGAWIEMLTIRQPFCFVQSHPTWVRGLK